MQACRPASGRCVLIIRQTNGRTTVLSSRSSTHCVLNALSGTVAHPSATRFPGQLWNLSMMVLRFGADRRAHGRPVHAWRRPTIAQDSRLPSGVHVLRPGRRKYPFCAPKQSVERSYPVHSPAVVLGMEWLLAASERSMERTLPVLEWDRWAALLVLRPHGAGVIHRKGDLHRFAGKAFMVLLMVTGAVFIPWIPKCRAAHRLRGVVWSVHLGCGGVRARI